MFLRSGFGLVLLSWVVALSGATAVRATAPESGLPQTLTLEEAVRIALDQSPAIGEAEARVLQSRGSAKAAMRAVLPTVSARANWSGQATSDKRPLVVEGRVVGTTDKIYNGNLSLSASQSLLDLPSLYDLRGSRASLAATTFDLSATRDQVELDVATSFYTSVAAVKLAEVEDNAVVVAREQLRRAETLFNLGSVARSDVLQAQVNLADSELTAINRTNAQRVERSRLALRMGLDPRIDLAIDTTLAIPSADPQGTIDDFVHRALEQRPDLAAAQRRGRATDLAVGAARLEWLPTLGTSVGVSHSGSSLEEVGLGDADWDRSYSLSLGLGYTIFDGFAREGRIQNAVGQQRAQREALDRQINEIALEVKEAHLSIEAERNALRAAREGVGLAEENLRLQQALYESGAGTLLEWDNARLDLRRARVSLIQSQVNLLLAHLRFRMAVGD